MPGSQGLVSCRERGGRSRQGTGADALLSPRSMMASRTATTPAMLPCSDPKVRSPWLGFWEGGRKGRGLHAPISQRCIPLCARCPAASLTPLSLLQGSAGEEPRATRSSKAQVGASLWSSLEARWAAGAVPRVTAVPGVSPLMSPLSRPSAGLTARAPSTARRRHGPAAADMPFRSSFTLYSISTSKAISNHGWGRCGEGLRSAGSAAGVGGWTLPLGNLAGTTEGRLERRPHPSSRNPALLLAAGSAAGPHLYFSL